MSALNRLARIAVGVALAVGPATPALADPSSSPSASATSAPSPGRTPAKTTGDTTSFPGPLSADYRLKPVRVRPGQAVTLIEYNVVGVNYDPYLIERAVTWGDGTQAEEFDTYHTLLPHHYAEPGVYHVSVRLSYTAADSVLGTFPHGNRVDVVVPSAGGLPVTGPGAGGLAATGAGVLVIGLLVFGTVRRRRVRFVR
jgi:LPXTG-motif cell wall-anchored protein